MKPKNEVLTKMDIMKINSFNFIQNEKYNSELEHEKNFAQFCNPIKENGQNKETHKIVDIENRRQSPAEDRRTMSDVITVTKTRTDFVGGSPKRYTTKCFIKPAPVPIWYTESLTLNIGSTKRTYKEQVYFKNKLRPFKWSENMSTEVKTYPKCIKTEMDLPIEESEFHYISLEPQQENTTSL